jgi:hypothetical protein
MIQYVDGHTVKCGIPPLIGEQLKRGRKNTENIQQKVCVVAQQMQQREPADLSLSDVLGSSAVMKRAPAGPVGDFWPGPPRF